MIDKIELLQDLIRARSITPVDDGALAILSTFLEQHGFACTPLTFEGDGGEPTKNLFATIGSGSPHLVYAGHTDVVPTGDETNWTRPPFSGDHVAGKIWGRGTADMKGSVAAFAHAAAQCVAAGFSGTLSFLITGDEEGNAINGTDKLLTWCAEQGIKFDFALVGEPSNDEYLGQAIKIGRRGSATFNLTVNGTQGHAAYPHLANNPLPILGQIVASLSALHFDDGTAHFPPTNLEFSTIDTGNTASNVIPASGKAVLNIRFNDLWNADKLTARLRQEIDAIVPEGISYSLDSNQRVSQVFIADIGPEVTALTSAIEQVTGHQPKLSTTGGTSDGRFITAYCPVVEFGLINKLIHKVDEHIEAKDYAELIEIFGAFITNYFSPESQSISRATHE